jgi:glycosyltransferase involved in cell wall biosynthesis
MQRICTSLTEAGYQVTLVGREAPNSEPIEKQAFKQIRLPIRHRKGKLFYWEYNRKLYKWLKKLAKESSGQPLALCAIDLDTIIPCYLVSINFHLPRVYDAHELFTELTEVKRRPWIHAAWKWVESRLVPHFPRGYTVNQFIADEFRRRYGVHYAVIRNLPKPHPHPISAPAESGIPPLPPRFFLYQGAINEGRAFDTLIPAMKQVALPLVLAGTGNYVNQVQELIRKHKVEDKVVMTGMLKPSQLRRLTPMAFAGLTLFDQKGLNQYHSLANRYFDYIQAGIPQVCVGFPEYRALQEQFEVALLIEEPSTQGIADAMNKLLNDTVLYEKLRHSATVAGLQWNWNLESERLIGFWNEILPLR